MAQHIGRYVLTNAYGRQNTSRDYNRTSAPAPYAGNSAAPGQARNRYEFLCGRSTQINPAMVLRDLAI
jgi:hypothetical protein